MRTDAENVDADVVSGFGEEWTRFRQGEQDSESLRQTFDAYFSIFPWSQLSSDACGFDLGCGSGRWARLVAPRCGHLVLIDPSDAALDVARENLRETPNVEFVLGAAGSLRLASDSFDFGYSLGVLHHTPDPLAGLIDAVRILKPGSPLLVYLYYALDNRGVAYRLLWRLSDFPRRIISRMPRRAKNLVCEVAAVTVYWPLARIARLVGAFGGPAERLPLAAYRMLPLYAMRTDARDRFGTRLELRFTRDEVESLMTRAGLINVVVSESAPYWCAVGSKPLGNAPAG
jgi:SAM-dependent methyltransferase